MPWKQWENFGVLHVSVVNTDRSADDFGLGCDLGFICVWSLFVIWVYVCVLSLFLFFFFFFFLFFLVLFVLLWYGSVFDLYLWSGFMFVFDLSFFFFFFWCCCDLGLSYWLLGLCSCNLGLSFSLLGLFGKNKKNKLYCSYEN